MVFRPKRLWLVLVAVLALLPVAFGQNATVSLTATDSDGQAWVNGNYQVTLVLPAGHTSYYDTRTGVPFTNTFQGGLDGTGSLSLSLVPTNFISPVGSQWKFYICPQVLNAGCGNLVTPITASGSISTQINAVLPVPRVTGGPGVYAYNDLEVAAFAPNTYFNVISQQNRCYATSWTVCQGSGGGTPSGPAGGALTANYPNPLLAIGALPNGMTATTQAPGDGTLKVATDAFVAAALPTTLPPSGTAGGALAGTYPNPTFPAQALANGMTATTQTTGDNSNKVATDSFVILNAAGFVNPMTSVGDIIIGGVGGVATRFPGNASTAQQILTSTANSIAWSSSLEQLGTVYLVDGYPSSCTVGATNYTTKLDCAFYTVQAALVTAGNHGAKLHLGNGVYQTCAGIVNSNANPAPTISLEGEGVGGTGNGFGVVGYSSIQASCAIPKTASNPTGAVIAHAPIVGSSISVPYGFTLENLVVDPNSNADQAVYLTAEKVGHVDHVGILSANQTSTLAPIQIGDSSTSQAIIVATVTAGAVASLYVESGGQYSTSTTAAITSFTVPTGCPGSGATGTFTTNGSTVVSAAVTAGGSGYVGGACAPIVTVPAGQTVSGSGYQYFATDVFVENGSSTGPSSWAVVTQTQSGGVPTFGITSGGSYHFANPVAYWIGYGATTAPCTTMGTLVPTMSGTGPYTVTALTGYGFSGCAAGTAYNIVIADFPQAQYGWEVAGDTDATFKDVVVGSVGTAACVAALSGSDVYDHVHPIDCNVGVYDIAQNKYIAPEYDSSFQYAHQLGVSAQDEIYGAEFQYAQAQPYTAGFFIPGSFTGYWELFGNDCNHGASVTGFALAVVGGAGPVAHGSGGVVYPGTVIGGMQCDSRAVVNYMLQSISGQTVVLADSGATAGVVIGTGAAASNFMAVSAGRGEFGYDNTNSNAVVQAGSSKGIEFNVNNTFGSGLVGKFDSSGNFGVGTNQTVSSDPFNVTAAGALTAGSVSALSGAFVTTSAGTETATSVTSVFGGSETVASSTTPTFSTSFATSYMVLTGNVTTFTLNNGLINGQHKTICLNQGTGGFTVAPPANVHGFMTPGTTASLYSCQDLLYNGATTIWLASSPGVINQ